MTASEKLQRGCPKRFLKSRHILQKQVLFRLHASPSFTGNASLVLQLNRSEFLE